MAESKRNSVAGKIATPKTSGTPATTPAPVQPALDPLEALGKSIGARVKLTAATPHAQSYEGTLFTACPILNVVILHTRPAAPPNPTPADLASQPSDYRVIPISRIQSFQVVSLAAGAGAGAGAADSTEPGPGFANAQPAIGPVDVRRLKEREAAKVEKLKEEERNRGKGVTKEAQAIFDSFKRINMPIRWHNQEMIVHEAVIIPPPYRVEDCKGAKDKQEVLNRVRKVLEGERKKIKEREERERKAATPAAPRKGG